MFFLVLCLGVNRGIILSMKNEFNVVIEQDADGYLVASVPGLPGCHTQAKSMDQLLERIKEAILLCLEDREEDWSGSSFVGIQRVAIDEWPAHPA